MFKTDFLNFLLKLTSSVKGPQCFKEEYTKIKYQNKPTKHKNNNGVIYFDI